MSTISDMLLRSGSSKQFRDMKTNELIAVNLSCFLRVDRGYDTFPIRALDWYNVSFDIAMEEGASDQNIATLVRDNGFRDFPINFIALILQAFAFRAIKDFIDGVGVS